MHVFLGKTLMVFLSFLMTAPLLAVTVGEKVADFQAIDAEGNKFSLAEYKDKYVVLEWVSPSCPFVAKHYDSGNMQKLQNEYRKQEVVWLSVFTKGESKFDLARDSQALNGWKKENSAAPDRLVMDAGGKLADQFGAKTTPHMFVINPAGELVYAGAIDDKRGTKVAEIDGAKNYVVAALDQALKGEAVAESQTKPYGCSVRY